MSHWRTMRHLDHRCPTRTLRSYESFVVSRQSVSARRTRPRLLCTRARPSYTNRQLVISKVHKTTVSDLEGTGLKFYGAKKCHVYIHVERKMVSGTVFGGYTLQLCRLRPHTRRVAGKHKPLGPSVQRGPRQLTCGMQFYEIVSPIKMSSVPTYAPWYIMLKILYCSFH